MITALHALVFLVMGFAGMSFKTNRRSALILGVLTIIFYCIIP